MTPSSRAHHAVRSYLDIGSTLSLGEHITQAIREAEKDAYKNVLSILQEHKQCESCVVIEELEGQIRELYVPSVAPLLGKDQ